MHEALADIRKLSSNTDVYEPSDDSFALVDALAELINTLEHTSPLCVEIGSGSGYVVCSVALLLKYCRVPGQCIAVDINPTACSCTQQTLQNHEVGNVDILTCDLLQPLLQRLEGKVDLLVFNPPYVPTPEEEVSRAGIAQAWAGGMHGRVVIDKVLPLASQLLSDNGHFLMVTVAENDPAGICREMREWNLEGSVVLKRQADEEILSILHFQRPSRFK